MCLILIGKGASGKDTVKDILVNKHGFNSLITYTTRKPRAGEIQDVTYHYISKDEFLKKIDDGFFAEWKSYIVNGELWYYGSAKEDFENADENTVAILTPDGVRDIKKNNINAVVIYLYANLDTIKKRLKKSNDTNDKMEDRIQRDAKDFKAADMIADKIVYNNCEMNINNVVDDILSKYRKARDEKTE